MDVHEVIRRWADAVNKGQMGAFGALYAADAVLYTPLTPQGVKGREAVKQYEGSISAAFPGASLKTSPVLAGGDTVAVEWEYSGKNTGPLATPAGTIAPTNRSVTLRGASCGSRARSANQKGKGAEPRGPA